MIPSEREKSFLPLRGVYLVSFSHTTQMVLSTSTLIYFTPKLLLHRTLKCVPYSFAIPISTSLASSSSSPMSLCVMSPAIRGHFRCISASASFGDSNSQGDEELSAHSPDVVILDIRGMMCEGCAASVKRLLESRPQVSSASVNLTAETATVWPVSEAKTKPNWHKQLGGALAEHLTNCGFESSLQVAGQEDSN